MCTTGEGRGRGGGRGGGLHCISNVLTVTTMYTSQCHLYTSANYLLSPGMVMCMGTSQLLTFNNVRHTPLSFL